MTTLANAVAPNTVKPLTILVYVATSLIVTAALTAGIVGAAHWYALPAKILTVTAASACATTFMMSMLMGLTAMIALKEITVENGRIDAYNYMLAVEEFDEPHFNVSLREWFGKWIRRGAFSGLFGPAAGLLILLASVFRG